MDEQEYVYDTDVMLDDIHFQKNFSTAPYPLHGEEGPTSSVSEPSNFEHLFQDSQHPLYFSCVKLTKLPFTLKMLHIKSFGTWSVKSFDMMFKLLKDAFPDARVCIMLQEALNRVDLSFVIQKYIKNICFPK